MNPSDSLILDLERTRAEALGTLLGGVDMVIMAKKIPDFFDVADKIDRLEILRAAYDEADAAYRNARLAVIEMSIQ